MVIKQKQEFHYGYNAITEEFGKYSNMMMDFGILRLAKAQSETLFSETKEIAVLLLQGEVVLEWEGNKKEIKRTSFFDEKPFALHVCKGVEIKVTAKDETEVIVQKTTNERTFESKFYDQDDCKVNVFGGGLMNGTAERMVTDIFKYENAPYSNMVLGEVVSYPGKWSSFPAHSHPQPEIYFYKFNKPQGFGCSFIGEDAYKIENNDTSAIPGGLVHPQVTAPGYAMYVCWMIRHFDGNPWTQRIDDPKHEWLYNPEAKIWPEK